MRNVGSGGTKAEVEVMPGDAVRVTIRMARPWKFRPGQHAYVYMPAIGLWTSHPFSLAWSEEEETLSEEKGIALNRQDILEMRKTSVSMICRRRTGFTERLFKKADLSAAGKFVTPAIIEGPYGTYLFSLIKSRLSEPPAFLPARFYSSVFYYHRQSYNLSTTTYNVRNMTDSSHSRRRKPHLVWHRHAMGRRHWYLPSSPPCP